MAGVLRNFNKLFRPILSKGIHSSSACSVKLNEPVPKFEGTAVVNQDFKTLKSEDFKGKWLVVYFYPLDFTFVCPTEIVSFSDRYAEFKAINTEVVGVSTDSHFSHLAFVNMPRKYGGLGECKYPLLSDFNKTISRDFDVLVEGQGIAYRGLFIVDPEQKVRHITMNDLPIGRSVDEVLRVVKALQFVEKHGEVCPANWNPSTNPDTIKPDPVKSKEYFNKQK